MVGKSAGRLPTPSISIVDGEIRGENIFAAGAARGSLPSRAQSFSFRNLTFGQKGPPIVINDVGAPSLANMRNARSGPAEDIGEMSAWPVFFAPDGGR